MAIPKFANVALRGVIVLFLLSLPFMWIPILVFDMQDAYRNRNTTPGTVYPGSHVKLEIPLYNREITVLFMPLILADGHEIQWLSEGKTTTGHSKASTWIYVDPVTRRPFQGTKHTRVSEKPGSVEFELLDDRTLVGKTLSVKAKFRDGPTDELTISFGVFDPTSFAKLKLNILAWGVVVSMLTMFFAFGGGFGTLALIIYLFLWVTRPLKG